MALPATATPVGNVGFDTPLFHYRVDAANPPWATWSNGYNKDVYWRDVFGNMAGGADVVTLSLPANTNAFYFYIEPGTFGTFDFDVTVTGGGGAPLVLSNISIDGQGGAKGYAFYTGPADPGIGSISIAGLNTWPDGFAIGEFGINGTAGPSVPDAGSTGVLLGAALALVTLLARRRLL